MWSIRRVSVPLSEEQIKGLLKRHDTNRDGKLSREELKAAFKTLGLHFSGWRAQRALRHADANEDGFINEEELNELILRDQLYPFQPQEKTESGAYSFKNKDWDKSYNALIKSLRDDAAEAAEDLEVEEMAAAADPAADDVAVDPAAVHKDIDLEQPTEDPE
ncbi:calcium-binding allergen Ole e 8-like [Cornus florida]|uniref:calcium-binding allergen Ole e 8-like n=1 Tax=Cornus florida TaxID=4283 RepID=UPI002898901B|nr:calcium-binding allergen Ole e 8-like [Cornus florida]